LRLRADDSAFPSLPELTRASSGRAIPIAAWPLTNAQPQTPVITDIAIMPNVNVSRLRLLRPLRRSRL